MQLTPYLTFPGTCEAALHFYRDVLEGELVALRYFDESELPVPDDYKKKVLHATLQIGEITMMASDNLPGYPLVTGNNVALLLTYTDLPEQERMFNGLAEDGEELMPLQETFWGARFGMLRDKFGINWMLSCELNK